MCISLLRSRFTKGGKKDGVEADHHRVLDGWESVDQAAGSGHGESVGGVLCTWCG